jgi:hypothetical protein
MLRRIQDKIQTVIAGIAVAILLVEIYWAERKTRDSKEKED